MSPQPYVRSHLGRFRPSLPPALHYPKYRAFWLGMLASVSGFQMLQFGQLWLMYQITGSPLSLGYVGLANAVPGIIFNLFGGVFADRLDKRQLILWTQAVISSLVFLLATLTLLGLVQQWHILTIAFLVGAVDAFNQPARQALYPHLIDRKVLVSAVALNSSIWQGTRIVAPAVAGAVIALIGTAGSFYLAGLGSVIMAAVIYWLKVPPIEQASRGNPLQGVWEGLSFIKKNSIFSFLMGMTFFNGFFGMSYVIMMPVFAVDILQVGPQGQGLLLSVSGVGALLTTLLLGSRANIPHKGLVIIGGAVMFGTLVAAFGVTSRLVGYFPLALALVFLIGVANSTYMLNVQSALHTLVPDAMRGRVMGFFGMTWSVMPLGGLQAGALAGLIGAPFAVAAGGLLVAAFALGPAMINRQVRNLGSLLRQAESSTPAQAPRSTTSPADN
ncbi:MAG TPA: MFS transporter [Dehalococcoidia bacterium]|nr:MFS transporter [Dehalococcoidia bacterium]